MIIATAVVLLVLRTSTADHGKSTRCIAASELCFVCSTTVLSLLVYTAAIDKTRKPKACRPIWRVASFARFSIAKCLLNMSLWYLEYDM